MASPVSACLARQRGRRSSRPARLSVGGVALAATALVAANELRCTWQLVFAGLRGRSGGRGRRDRLRPRRAVDDTLVDEDPSERLLGFGKHEALTYQEALSKQPDYCHYILGFYKVAIQYRTNAFGKWLEDRGSQDWSESSADGGASKRLVGLGEHKTLTYEEAFNKERGFCAQVLKKYREKYKDKPQNKMTAFGLWLEDQDVEGGALDWPEDQDPRERLVGFGKHRTLTYQEVLDRHAGYCKWLLAHVKRGGQRVTPKMKSLGQWLEDQDLQEDPTDGDPGKRRVGFGELQDSTYEEVLQKDPALCTWALQEYRRRPDSSAMTLLGQWIKDRDGEGVRDKTSEDDKRLVGFGKHADLTYQEVLSKEPAYCEWVVDEYPRKAHYKVNAFGKWLEDQGFEGVSDVSKDGDRGQRLLGFGQHRASTYEEVLKKDPIICTWALQEYRKRHRHPKTLFGQWLESHEGKGVHDKTSGEDASADEDPGKRLVGFGKHRALTYEEALSKEPDYGEWFVHVETTKKSYKVNAFGKWLEDQGFEGVGDEELSIGDEDPDKRLLGVGKYKGLTYVEVLMTDPKYCMWILSRLHTARSAPLKAFGQWLEDQDFDDMDDMDDMHDIDLDKVLGVPQS